MVDVDTFLTALYVMVDDFCHSRPQKERGFADPMSRSTPAKWSPSPSSPGGAASAVSGTFTATQRAICRTLSPHPARPLAVQSVGALPSVRLIEEVALHLATAMEVKNCLYQALDSSAIPVRDAKRRGEGWLAGFADIGWSNRLGWYEGFCLLVAVDPTGVITGLGFAPASTKDQPLAQPLAETFFAARHQPNPRLPRAWDRRPEDPMWPTRALRVEKKP
jgi:hypothetical protein